MAFGTLSGPAFAHTLRKLLRHDRVVASLSRLPFDWPGIAAMQGRLLIDAGRLAEADALLSVAVARWPNDGHVCINHAFVAEARGDMAACLERWQANLARLPDLALAHAGLGGTLRKLGRLEQARAVLVPAQARFPEDRHIAIESGWLLHDLGEYQAAIASWQVFNARFPDRFEGPLGVATALRSLLAFDAADAMLEEAMRRFPRLSVLATNYATNAEARGDAHAALDRWRQVIRDYPDQPIGYAGTGAALKTLGQFDAADTLLADAMQRFPDDANLGINYAWVADARQDWAAAAQRWQGLAVRFPGHPVIRTGESESRMKAKLAVLEHDPPGAGRDPAGLAQDERGLLMQFEAIGENCELGFVQRHFGAEPIGLLRWAGITLERLVAGLDADFAGVGDPDNTIMQINPQNREYFTADHRYGMNMHTFILEDAAKREATFARICRRLVFLREKLLRDLAEASKIFVYQSSQCRSDAELHGLLAALRRHGPVTLLAVQPAGAGPVPGAVEILAPGLLVGFLDRVGYDGKRWDISFDHWLAICQRAAAWQSMADAAARAACAD